jgi:hypothetical protein
MMLSHGLENEDSGCLAIDVEGEAYGHTHPYVLYLGINNLGRGTEGMGLFIAPALHQWHLKTCRVVSGSLENA